MCQSLSVTSFNADGDEVWLVGDSRRQYVDPELPPRPPSFSNERPRGEPHFRFCFGLIFCRRFLFFPDGDGRRISWPSALSSAAAVAAEAAMKAVTSHFSSIRRRPRDFGPLIPSGRKKEDIVKWTCQASEQGVGNDMAWYIHFDSESLMNIGFRLGFSFRRFFCLPHRRPKRS